MTTPIRRVEEAPQWEDCKVCGGDHWTKDHSDIGPVFRLGPQPVSPNNKPLTPEEETQWRRRVATNSPIAAWLNAEVARLFATLDRAALGLDAERLADELHELFCVPARTDGERLGWGPDFFGEHEPHHGFYRGRAVALRAALGGTE